MDRFSAGGVIYTLEGTADTGKCPYCTDPVAGLGRQVRTHRAAVPPVSGASLGLGIHVCGRSTGGKPSAQVSLSSCTRDSKSGAHRHLENSGVEKIILILAPPVPLINYVLRASCLNCLNILICRMGGGSASEEGDSELLDF